MQRLFFFKAQEMLIFILHAFFKQILLCSMMRKILTILFLSVALAFTQGISAHAQSAPTSFKVDSTTQAALRADKKANELYAKVKAIEESGKASEKKAELIKAYMEFANYMTFSAPLPPAIKYRPALKAYRRVLELEPMHAEAQKNKAQIEEIYKAMGRPIPQD
jgi:tetratricopeptide (TPR) repeat protein